MYHLPCGTGAGVWGTYCGNVAFRSRGRRFDLLVGVSVKPGVSQCSRSVWGAVASSVVPGPELPARTALPGRNHAFVPAGIHSKYSGPVFEMASVLSADGHTLDLGYWS